MRCTKTMLIFFISLWLVSFLSAETGLLGGVLRNQSGKALPAVKPELFQNGELICKIEPDAAGAFILRGLKAGLYTFSVKQAGFEDYDRELNIKNASLYILNPRFKAKPGAKNLPRIVNKISNQQPLPLSGAYVAPAPDVFKEKAPALPKIKNNSDPETP